MKKYFYIYNQYTHFQNNVKFPFVSILGESKILWINDKTAISPYKHVLDFMKNK